PNGKPLISRTSAWQLTTDASGGSVEVQWVDASGTPVNITGQLSQGKLGGFIHARDTFLTDYRNKLDTLAAGLINAVNSVHRSGMGLSGTTDLPLFMGSAAGDIAINPTI